MSKVIDYEKLEEPIKRIDEILADYDAEEKNLILRQLTQRYQKERQKSQMSDLMGSVDPTGLMNKVMRKQGGDDEEKR